MIVNILRRSIESTLLFLVLLLAILFAVKPWSAYFLSGFAEHFDPKIMGEWMAWNADHILNGQFMTPDYNANFFYPHSYSLAFGEMLWPQSFVYAIPYALFNNIFLNFNGTMLIFWALAGVAMYVLLREMSMNRAISYLGSFIYTLLPYNLGHYHEFNMMLVFIIPLLFLLLIRWLRRLTVTHALLFCAGFWLSLTSSIYYTVIVFPPLVIMFIAYVINDRRILKRREFYYTSGIIIVSVLVISAVYLYPYISLRLDGDYVRSRDDHMRYHAQVTHYIATRYSAFWPELFKPTTRAKETILFPGTALTILFLAYVIASVVRFPWRIRSIRPFQRYLSIARFLLWFSFWVIILLNIFFVSAGWIAKLNFLLYPVTVTLLGAYLFALWRGEEKAGNKTIVSAMAAGAVVCFFVSLGPVISMGPDPILLTLSKGPMSGPLETLPFFGAVRGLERFAIVVQFYLVVVSCYALSILAKKKGVVLWLCAVVPLLMIYEGRSLRYKYTDYVDRVNSTVVKRAKALPENSVIVQIPTGPREKDGNIVMHTIGDFHYVINGVSGFVPADYRRIKAQLKEWRIDEITQWLTEIWPPVYLVLDHSATRWLERGWRKPFPYDELEDSWTLLETDPYYALYQLKRSVLRSRRITCRIRSDVLKRHSVLKFTARVTDSMAEKVAEFQVRVNNRNVGKFALNNAWTGYEIKLPQDYLPNLAGDEVVLKLLSSGEAELPDQADGQWEVKYLTFKPTGSSTMARVFEDAD